MSATPISFKDVKRLLAGLTSVAQDDATILSSLQELTTATSSNPNNSAKIGPKGIEAVLSCLKTHTENAAISGASCDALGALADDNFINKKRLSSLPFAAAIAMSMRAHADDLSVLLKAVSALMKISVGNGRNASSIVREGIEDILLKAMTSTHTLTATDTALQSQMQSDGSKLLGVLAATGEGLVEKISNNIARLMKAAEPTDSLTQGNACHIFQYIANSDKNAESTQVTRDCIAREGVIALLVRAMKAAICAPAENDPNQVIVG